MSMPRKPVVVITGATGLIGSRLSSDLARDHAVFALDIKQPDREIDGVQWIECDLTAEESVRHALETIAAAAEPQLASVIHLAAYYDFSGEPSDLYRELTVEGTRRLLRGLRSFQVEQFVFSSSLLVMEPVEEKEALTEKSPTAGEWDYPASKLAAEQVIREERGSMPAIILRIAGVYDEDGHSIPIGHQIRRIYEESMESHFFPGDMTHGQPFVHVDDLVACFRKVVERRAELGPYEIFLIAEDEVMSYRDLQDQIGKRLHGEEWFTMRIPKSVAKAGAWVKDNFTSDDPFIKPWMIDLADDHYPVDIAKARKRLAWQPQHRLRETLPEMLARLQQDPRRWYEINGFGEPPADRVDSNQSATRRERAER